MKVIITAIIIAAVISGSAGAASLLIDGSKLKNHSVPVTKLTASAVRSLHGQRGAQGVPGVQGIQGQRGVTGVQGIQGQRGVTGPSGVSGYVSGTGSTVSVAAGAQGTAFSWCPAGTQPLGGGYFAEGNDLRTVSAAFAIQDVTNAPGFSVTMANEGGSAESFHIQGVHCAHVS